MTALKRLKQAIKSIVKGCWRLYAATGSPLLPITRLLQRPLRWYYHRSPVLRHDTRFCWKPRLLSLLHDLLIKDHPGDFMIYRGQLKFRSQGSIMSVQAYYVGEVEYHLLQYIV